MALMEKYRKAIELTGKLPIQGLSIEEKAGKLHIVGTAPYQLEKDLVWDAIKEQPGWEADLVCDLKVESQDVYGYWVVQAGDSLSKVAKRCYDDGNKYMKIFEANKDILKDPNQIKPGQKLKIPNV
ncbi:MAG TPA: LysM peptidoglycan-binding domain-containing protein [Vicinamibacteria bacterium]|nr:LysM peptidoglycan-binding domain-containing protein [Vicinamibacteria bacterium]